MSRLAQLGLQEVHHYTWKRDEIVELKVYEKVNTSKRFYVEQTYKQLVTDGIGAYIAKRAKTLYGNDVITKEVTDFITSKKYKLEDVFTVASPELVNKAVESGDLKGVNSLHNDDMDMIATALVDTDGKAVFVKTKKDGTAYKKGYSFTTFFKTFVVPALLEVAYKKHTDGKHDYRLYSKKSVGFVEGKQARINASGNATTKGAK